MQNITTPHELYIQHKHTNNAVYILMSQKTLIAKKC